MHAHPKMHDKTNAINTTTTMRVCVSLDGQRRSTRHSLEDRVNAVPSLGNRRLIDRHRQNGKSRDRYTD